MRKKTLSLFLALSLCLGLLTLPATAAEVRYDDTAGHWAEGSIQRWSGYHIVEGDGGHFHPDRSLTRGEMAKILANTLGLTDQGEKNPFADIPADAWYTPYVLRCSAAGIMEGDGVNANPDAVITRQETMTVLCRALNIEPMKDADLSAYVDGGTVADWAVPYVAAMTKAGIVKGVGEDQLAPARDVTRGSVMAILDRVVGEYINAPGSYDLTGKTGLVLVASGDVTFTGRTSANILVTKAATGKELTFDKAEVTGSITVQADNAKVVSRNNAKLPEVVALGNGVKTETAETKRPSSGGGSGSGSSSRPTTPTYTNLTVSEAKTVDETTTYQDVTITDAVGDGTVTLANMTILGNLYINGGGASTVNLTNVVIKGKIIMAKVGGERPRLNLTNTPVAAVEVDQPATIQADAASAVTAVQAKADVYVIGADTAITAVTIPAGVTEAVAVSVTAGTVAKVEARSEVNVSGSTNAVKEVVAEAPVTVAAAAVEKVEVPASAGENVTVAVTGAGSVEVAVNSEKGAAITAEADGEGTKATIEVSTTLDTPPAVTVDGEEQHIHQWGAWEKVDDTNHKRVCKGDETHIETEAHTLGEWVKVDEASHKKTCSVCKGEVTAAHTEVIDAAVPATCTEAGKTEGKHCSDCNTVLVAQKTVAALGHDFTGAYLTDAEGHWHKCARCDVTDTKAAHTYPAGATCDAATNCTACGYTKAAGSHAWDEGKVTAQPTCTEKGVRTFICTVCKQTRTGDVDALGHDYAAEFTTDKAPTCTEAGSKSKHCSRCDSTTEVTAIPAAGHSWGAWTKKDDTDHRHICSVCKTEETEAHTWDQGVVTKEPTETSEGVKTYTCATCKGTKTEAIPAAPAITLSVVNNQVKVEFSKPEDCNQFGLYCYDNKGTQVGYSYMYEGFPDAAVVLPAPTQNGVYTLTIKGWGDDVASKEIARLANCIEIKVEGTALEYEMAFDAPENGKHTATLTGTPSGAAMRYIWTRDGAAKNGGVGSVGKTLSSIFTAQDGDLFDLRLITSYEVESNVLKVSMTPESIKTYTASSEPNLCYYKQSTGDTELYLKRDEANVNSYYVDGKLPIQYVTNDTHWGISLAHLGLLSMKESGTHTVSITKGQQTAEPPVSEISIPVTVVEGTALTISVGEAEKEYIISGDASGYDGYMYQFVSTDGTVLANGITAGSLTLPQNVEYSDGCKFIVAQVKFDLSEVVKTLTIGEKKYYYYGNISGTMTTPQEITNIES